MTLEQFRATRTESNDIGKAIGQPEFFLDDAGTERAAAGFIYDGDCYIERLEDGRFYLIIGNEEWIDGSIEPLERELHQWAVDECLFG